MISVEEAKNTIKKNFTGRKITEVKLIDACGLLAAEDLVSPIDFPPFDQSAMDGFAFSFDLWDKKSPLAIIGEMQAGGNATIQLQANQSIRIFTGALVPLGADTIVIKENVLIENDSILIKDPNLQKGLNCRLKASQCKKGEKIMNKGSRLHPAGISFLAGLGISKLKIYDKPSVSIISTGKELTQSEEELTVGKIYESNSIGLTAALNECGIIPQSIDWVDDIPELIEQSIDKNLDVDLLILTGGVSVGDYDFVPESLAKCGVQKLFHKVKQKPGKPLYLGKKNQTLVFGLPGNPAAVMTCFYQYILPLISEFTGISYLSYKTLKLEKVYNKKAGLTHFLKGKTEGEKVKILSSQESYLMNSFAYANCLVEIGESIETINENEEVKVCVIDSVSLFY